MEPRWYQYAYPQRWAKAWWLATTRSASAAFRSPPESSTTPFHATFAGGIETNDGGRASTLAMSASCSSPRHERSAPLRAATTPDALEPELAFEVEERLLVGCGPADGAGAAVLMDDTQCSASVSNCERRDWSRRMVAPWNARK